MFVAGDVQAMVEAGGGGRAFWVLGLAEARPSQPNSQLTVNENMYGVRILTPSFCTVSETTWSTVTV